MSDSPFDGMSPAEVAWADQKFARAASGVDGLIRVARSAQAPKSDAENMMAVVRALEGLPEGEKRQDMVNHWVAVAVVRLARLEQEKVA